MNDTETNPQRHGESPDGEPTHRSADASRESLPARDAADTTAHLRSETSADPTAQLGAVSTPAGSEAAAPQTAEPSGYEAPRYPASGYPTGGQAGYGAGQPGYGGGQPAAPQPAAPQPGGWHRPTPAESAAAEQAGAAPASAAPGWQPGQPPATSPQGQYDPYSPQGYAQQQYYGQHGQYGVPHGSSTSQLPPWASAVGGGPTDDPRRPGKGRKVVLVGAAAVVLALSSAGIGAWSAIAFSDAGVANQTTTASTDVQRVVDRSSLAEIAKKAQDSVVSISTGNGSGSGVVLTVSGFILSNNHVVASAQGNTVNVTFQNGKSAQARIIGTDPRTDLAVVQVSGVTDLKPATLGDSSKMEIGDTVLALGSPLGLEGSVTSGIISAKDRTIQASDEGQPNSPLNRQQGAASISNLLQTDAPINPGNSGGALVNTNAEVIGINTAIATAGQSTGNIGVGFAIPSNKAKIVADALINGKKVSHPYLGVSLSASTDGNGAVVGTISPNSPAAKAGLQQNDVITEANGKAVHDADDVIAAVQAGAVGSQVQLKYLRNGQEATATATLAEAP